MKKLHFLTQSRVCCFIAFYIGVLLNLPIFLRRFHQLHADAALSTGIEVLAAFALVLFTTLLASLAGRLLFRILTTLLVVFSVAASYYMIFFNVTIGYGIVAAAMATDSLDLSRESVGWHFSTWLVLVSLLPVLMLWLAPMPEAALRRRNGWAFLRRSGVMMAAGLCCWVPLKVMGDHQDEQDRINNRMMASYGGVVAGSYSPSNWLSGMGLLAYSSWSEAEDNRNLFDPAEHFTYTPPKDVNDLYIVFVIGESARRDHMGIYGYDRDNTPNLDKEKNLAVLQGYSCDTATKLSLRCMFVREGGASESPERTLKEMNVFSVLKKQGFSSELFSMQSEAWFYNKTMADYYALRETIQSEKRNVGKPIDDMALVSELRDSVDRHPDGKHLVILHTKGSHYLYTERYPRAWARYQPECLGIDDQCSTQEMVNSYDNSLLYTDHVLKSVFDQLRNRNALVFYASDHGESISENMHFHGTPRNIAPMAQRTIPVMVWASDKFLQKPDHAAAFAQLKKLQKAKTPVFHEKLYDSILGCAGFTSPDGGINELRNWCHVSS
ncbi:kdo(2)-lipid A phosphoethanolamine 7''-transferase [Erwinia sp. P6884]|uniref:kdo(2)-lipid A phosphoethanolamine 7''-transferase n=1 Tax=Erwinia sp. P6884 TaxID=3141450 RepID=UPI00319A6A1E